MLNACSRRDGTAPLLLMVLALSACAAHLPKADQAKGLKEPASKPTSTDNAPPVAASPSPERLAQASLSADGLTFFFTTDEHGQIAEREHSGRMVSGAANLAAYLKQEGFVPGQGKALLLSGGDSWTGPAVSTYFKGESTMEVFNALGYDAAALGNHDLDFGQEILAQRVAQARYPILAANVIREDGKHPAGVRAYALLDAAGLKVGIVGLGYPNTPHIALAENIQGLKFLAPAAVLEDQVPKAKAAGADLIIVLAHLCGPALLELTPLAARLGVTAMLGGHCHERMVARKDGVLVIEGGHYLETVSRVDLRLDPKTHVMLDAKVKEIAISYPVDSADPVTPDPVLAGIVARWEHKAEEKLGTVIGYTETGINVGPSMYAMITDAWLSSWPSAQVALSNTGAFRQGIPPGEITLADIVAVLPFENTLIEAKVTGAQLLENLACCGGAVAGITYEVKGGLPSAWLPDKTPIDPTGYYLVIMNSFMWGGGDGYRFHKQALKVDDTSIHWRAPVIRWIESQKSSAQDPLEKHLQSKVRFRPLPRPTEGAPAE